MKLDFINISKDGKTTYYINDNEVSEMTYFNILAEYYSDPNNYDKIEEDNIEDECNEDQMCESCQSIMDLLYALEEMDDDEALNTMRNVLDDAYRTGYREGLTEAYSAVNELTGQFLDEITEFDKEE